MSDSNAKIKVIISHRPNLFLHILTSLLPSLQTKLASKYPWGAQGDVVWGWRAQLGVTLLQDLLAVGYWGVNGAYLVQWIYKALEFIQTGEWKKVFQRVLAQLKGGGCLRDRRRHQNGWIFGKVPKGGVGHFQSKNLYCRFWTFK